MISPSPDIPLLAESHQTFEISTTALKQVFGTRELRVPALTSSTAWDLACLPSHFFSPTQVPALDVGRQSFLSFLFSGSSPLFSGNRGLLIPSI
jgi:hypothetical protein